MKKINPVIIIYAMIATAGFAFSALALGHRFAAACFFIGLLGESWLWIDGVMDRMQNSIDSMVGTVEGRHQRRHNLKLIKGNKDEKRDR